VYDKSNVSFKSNMREKIQFTPNNRHFDKADFHHIKCNVCKVTSMPAAENMMIRFIEKVCSFYR
jgi:hypothetical protein